MRSFSFRGCRSLSCRTAPVSWSCALLQQQMQDDYDDDDDVDDDDDDDMHTYIY